MVVEHGKNGKRDKYYIIPSGAPVIFEDEDGNELTRYVHCQLELPCTACHRVSIGLATSVGGTNHLDGPGLSLSRTSTAERSVGESWLS